MNNLNKLTAKVNAVDRANRCAEEIYPLLANALRPFVGEKVLKQNGVLTKKVEDALPSLPQTHGIQSTSVHFHFSKWALCWIVKTCENIEGTCTYLYHEVAVYVGEVKDSILTKLCNPPEHYPTYTVKEVANLIQRVEEAKNKYEELRSSLYPFENF